MAYAETPKGLSKWEQFVNTAKAFGLFLYNKEKGEVMGRGAKSWGKITIFFIIFYLCLAGFFAGMLNAFLATMPDPKDGPKLTQYLAGKSDAFSVVPAICWSIPWIVLRTLPSHNIKNFDKNDKGSYGRYVDSINSFLKGYKDQSTPDFAAGYCNYTSTDPMPASQKKQCRFDLTKLGPCYSNADGFSYGYGDGAPCFFLKMNKVFNWVPEPEDGLSYVKIDCGDGVDVYPSQTPGFPVSFYPFRGQDNWMTPIVAIKFNGTANKQVKCRASAKNVEQSDTYLLERGAMNRIRISIKE